MYRRYSKSFIRQITPDGPPTPPATISEGEETMAEIVISGISCRLPESDNIDEFWQNLISGNDMVTETNRRWPPGLHGIPPRMGTIKDISKFDAAHFGIPPKQAHLMDPQLRMLIECAHEALVDSGNKPDDLRGSLTGCYMASTHSDAHDLLSQDPSEVTGYEMTGCNRTMLSNRVSFSFDLKGPSMTLDTACSSGLEALCNAVSSIKDGRCEAALVGASSLLLRPETSLQFNMLSMLSPDGACKSFDRSGNGYARSEGVVVMYLQKAEHAKRIHARIASVMDNCDGHKDQGITFPSERAQQELLSASLTKANVNPNDLTYFEAHGTGTAAGDPVELNSITEVICSKRREPLYIGSVKSNMGHGEAVAGLAAITKVVLAMKYKMLPRNLHFRVPNPNIPALLDGRLQTVIKNTPWDGGAVGINSFGFGGANVHAILKSPSNIVKTSDDSNARLVVVAGRNIQKVQSAMDLVKKNPRDLALHHMMTSLNGSGKQYPCRGYVLLDTEKVISESKEVKGACPVWFVFPGMGQQWHGMGKDMLKLPMFQKHIDECEKALQEEGFSVLDLINSDDTEIFNDPLNAAVGISSIQVALVEMLKELGIKPDGIVGHSVGELGCAFADGTLTAGQTVRVAYWRGRCIKEANLPLGGMAAIGMTWEEAKAACPERVVPACHNAISSVTISGPKEDVSKFVKELSENGTFAREVNSSGVAFHSYLMKRCAPQLQSALEKIIPSPKPRSSSWISSSIPESEWNTSLAQMSSAEYHVNNFTSPVLFHDAVQHIPPNSVIIEIGAQGLFQGVLKRALAPSNFITCLMKKGEQRTILFLLSNIGKCHTYGVEVHPEILYDQISYPVPMETPLLSTVVGWNHETTWKVPQPHISKSSTYGAGSSGDNIIEINVSEDNYVIDHVIDGKIVFPAMGLLHLVWQAFARSVGSELQETPVVFTQCQIHTASVLQVNVTIEYNISVSMSTGHFELSEKGELVVDGYIHILPNPKTESYEDAPTWSGNFIEENFLSSDDFYKLLRVRGYEYGPEFCTVQSAAMAGNNGTIQWRGGWVPYLDALLQVGISQYTDRTLRLPTRFKRLEINPAAFGSEEEKVVPYTFDVYTQTVKAPGAELKGAIFTSTPRRIPHKPPIIEEFTFSPYIEDPTETDQEYRVYAQGCVQFACEDSTVIVPENKSINPQIQKVSSTESLEDGSLSRKGGKRSLPPLLDSEMKGKPGVTLATILAKRHESKYSLLDHILNSQGNIRVDDGSPEDNFQVYNDCLLTGSLNKHDLKSAIDVFIENSMNQRIKLHILCPAPVLLYPYTAKTLRVTQHYAQIQFSITVSTTDPSQIDLDLFKKLNVKVADWSFGNGVPSEHISSANIILASNFLTDRDRERTQELRDLCHNVSNSTYLFVHEWTHSSDLYSYVKQISSDIKRIPELTKPYPTRTFLEDQGLVIVNEKYDGVLASLISCKKSVFTPGRIEHVICNDLQFKWVKEIQTKYEYIKNDPNGRIWLISEATSINGLIGMVSCLLQEPIGTKLRCLFNAEPNGSGVIKSYLPGTQGWDWLLHKDLVMNIFCNGQHGSFRRFIVDQKYLEIIVDCARVELLNKGDLTSIKWVSVPSPPSPMRLKAESISVTYASVNFRDIMLATGRLSSDAIPASDDRTNQGNALGLEFSGLNEFGERRMGVVPLGGMATEVSVQPKYLWPVPQTWNLSEAASVPMAYVTAFYALIVRGNIHKGERILIHSGTSTVGQAAIRISISRGCLVYTTAGTPEKMLFLQKEFGIPTERIYYSRSTSFADEINQQTKGLGIDVVLNSLAEEKMQLSMDLLAANGRFLEIGKFDLSNNSKMGMGIFLKNITFHGVLVENILDPSSQEWVKVWKLVHEGINRGFVKPLKTHIFLSDQLEKAFRFMADGKHIGKVLIRVRKEETSGSPAKQGRKLRSKKTPVRAVARTYFRPEKVVIITGGLGGLGLEMANWLVERGCRRLVLTSRSGVQTGYQRRLIAHWETNGVEVLVSKMDVTSYKDTVQLITKAKEMGPVGGVFHLAAVLQDTYFASMTMDKWKPVTDVKVTGSINLDKVTRSQCAETLEHFVTFSSASSGYGNAGQSNYGYANSFMERLCERRIHDGHAGKSIQWGFIGDVGIVQDSLAGNKLYHLGLVPQRIESFLETLDLILQMPQTVVSSVVPADRSIQESSSPGIVMDGSDGEVGNIIMNILGVDDMSTVDPSVPLSEYGLDSLMTTEIRQTLGRRFNLQLTVLEVQSLSLDAVKDMLKPS